MGISLHLCFIWFLLLVSYSFLHISLLPPSVQFSSVTQSCPTLCDPMNLSMPGIPVHHQLLESTQTHAHRVSDAIHSSHPLSSPSPPAPNPSQHQALFQWVNCSHEVAKLLEFQLQHPSFLPMNTQDWSPLGWTGWISLQSKGLSRVTSWRMFHVHFWICSLLLLNEMFQKYQLSTSSLMCHLRAVFPY